MKIYPHQFTHLHSDKAESATSIIELVKHQFTEMKTKGEFNVLDSPAFIIQKIESLGLVSLGLVCLTSIIDYEDLHILTHEKTLEEKEKSQLELQQKRNAIVKPVLLTYPNHEALDKYLHEFCRQNQSFLNIRMDDNQSITCWKVEDFESIDFIQKYFKEEIGKVYVADGHHRLSTFSKFKDSELLNFDEKILSIYIPFDDLQIFEFNRIFTFESKINVEKLCKKMEKYCFMELIDTFFAPKFKYQFHFFIDNKIYACVWKPTLLQRFEKEPLILDTALLNAVLFKEVFEVNDIRTDHRIQYLEGKVDFSKFYDTVNESPNNVGFYLYPINFNDFKKVSELGLKLPPKSTWFEPRIRNGVVIFEGNI